MHILVLAAALMVSCGVTERNIEMPVGVQNGPAVPRPRPKPTFESPGREREKTNPLARARGKLQTALDTRFQKEISDLTVRYGGNVATATRVAEARRDRNFAASDPDFATTIAPLQAKVTELEEQAKRASARRAGGTIGGNNGETLG